MARFDLAIGTVLEHEGGYVNDPHDPGGATNYGISLRYLRTLGDLDGDGWLEGDLDQDGDLDVDDIRLMTVGRATEIYRDQWWNRYRYRLIQSQAVATKVFDLAVNMGPGRAHRLLQQALRACGNPVEVDGQVGAKTRAAVREALARWEDKYWEPGDPWPVPGLLAALRSEAAGYYRSLVATRNERERFIRGWLRRAYS